MYRVFIPLALVAATAIPAIAQDASARTVQYHSQDIVPIRAKLKYTTLIEVPPTEKIMEAATGDKDFWVVDVVGNFCFVHPAKAGISSNLNIITDKGNIYSFTLQDVSSTSAGAGVAQESPRSQRRSAKEYEACDVPRRSRSRHLCGGFQCAHEADFGGARCDATPATAAHGARQHRQQHSGPEESTCRRETEGSGPGCGTAIRVQ